MVDVNTKTCIKCVVKQASFNYDGEKAKYCATCKPYDMIDVICKKS